MNRNLLSISIKVVLVLLLFTSCGLKKVLTEKNQKDSYSLIESVNYVDKSLYYKTLSFDQLPATHMFSYNEINEENVKYNSITEKGRYVNFDTIFNQEQRQEIDSRLKNLESVKLKKSQMSNPEVLSKIRTPYGTPMDEQRGFNSVTFPVIVNSAKGVPFGFIYRDSSGLLHIYKKEENNWEEFARVEIHFVH